MGIEVHAPFHLDHAWLLRHIEVMERTGTKHYGFIPDFGMFTSRYPRVQRERFVRQGVRPHIADYICEAYEQRILAEYIVGNVREMGATPLEIGMAETTRHQIWSNPKRLLEHMPRIFHIHAKFYEMLDDCTEYSIPYEQIIPILIEGGYDGYLSSEYEGNRHIQDAFEVDSVEQVRRQHVMFKRLLGEEA
jgi:sugar phosphate isomerase/epimerase